MKDVTTFADVGGTVTRADTLDVEGSTIDKIFAEAILVAEPKTVLEENGIIRVKKVPMEVDQCDFPIVRNTQFTWNTISRAADSTGSDLAEQALNAMEYKTVLPIMKTASIFIGDTYKLVNKADFELLVGVAAKDAKRQKEVDALKVLETGSNVVAGLKVGTSYADAGEGSVETGSVLTPTDLVNARRDLMTGLYSTGSNVFSPDFVLVHPIQYVQLSTHSDFTPANTNNDNWRRAKFDGDGELIKFAGMDVIQSDLLTEIGSGEALEWNVTGHIAVVGQKQMCIGRGEKEGFIIHSEDSRRHHGIWKVFDMWYDNTILVAESILFVGCADV